MSQDDIYSYALSVPGDCCLFHFYLVMVLCCPILYIMDSGHSIEHLPGKSNMAPYGPSMVCSLCQATLLSSLLLLPSPHLLITPVCFTTELTAFLHHLPIVFGDSENPGL